MLFACCTAVCPARGLHAIVSNALPCTQHASGVLQVAHQPEPDARHRARSHDWTWYTFLMAPCPWTPSDHASTCRRWSANLNLVHVIGLSLYDDYTQGSEQVR